MRPTEEERRESSVEATASVSPAADLESIREALLAPLADVLPGSHAPYSIDYLCPPKPVTDDTAKLRIADAQHRPVAVALVSNRVAPQLVARAMRRAADARRRLDAKLGSAILEPVLEGDVHGRSYAVLPHCSPVDTGWLGRRYWRRALRGPVLEWLAEVNRSTRSELAGEEERILFRAPLEHLEAAGSVDASVRAAAGAARAALEAGTWTPRTVLMHGDLWTGNLLRANASPRLRPPEGRPPFIVIDWPGSLVRGHAFYDLIRVADSMRLPKRGLQTEIERHCAIMGCDRAGAAGHLLAGLGHIGLDLGAFPLDRFAALTKRCLEDILPASYA